MPYPRPPVVISEAETVLKLLKIRLRCIRTFEHQSRLGLRSRNHQGSTAVAREVERETPGSVTMVSSGRRTHTRLIGVLPCESVNGSSTERYRQDTRGPRRGRKRE